MAQQAPGKAHREGITLMQLADMFPTEDAAREWFQSLVWADGRTCPRCGDRKSRQPHRRTDALSAWFEPARGPGRRAT